MNQKIILIAVIIGLILVGGLGFLVLSLDNAKDGKPKTILTPDFSGQATGAGQNSEKTKVKLNAGENLDLSAYEKIAEEYVLSKPEILVDGKKLIAWDEYGRENSDFAKASPAWIIGHAKNANLIDPGTFKAPYEDLNGRYLISWHFIPGCSEILENANQPNWFDELNRACLGGYELRIIINPDGSVVRAELNALD